jgi:hypothetical protein
MQEGKKYIDLPTDLTVSGFLCLQEFRIDQNLLLLRLGRKKCAQVRAISASEWLHLQKKLMSFVALMPDVY